MVEIDDDDELYRRLFPAYVDRNGVVSSAAFKRNNQPDNQISVDLARLTVLEDTLARAPKPGYGLGVLVARYPRSLGFAARHDPIPENDAHSLIEGENDRVKCRLLAENTIVRVFPDALRF